MSELTDQYAAEIPDRCLKCPLVESCISWAESSEASAANLTEDMLTMIESVPMATDAVLRDGITTVGAAVVRNVTNSEMHAHDALSRLVAATQLCPGLKRGFYPNETLGSKIVSFLQRSKVCRVQNASDIIGEAPAWEEPIFIRNQFE